MSEIRAVKAREVIDSRGNPTVEVELDADEGKVRAIVPSGASTGKHEALELRDKDKRFLGKGVLKAVDNINTIIARKIIGMQPDLDKIDALMNELDGTDNKNKLGANAILAVSMAVCKAGALAKHMSLYQHITEISNVNEYVMPVPCMNIINGGMHAGNNLDIQEYMIMPINASSFKEALQMGCETYHTLKKIIEKRYGRDAINVGDEGGFAPALNNAEEPINLITEAINELGYNDKIKIGLDCAASEFFQDGKYAFEGKEYTGGELIDFYKELVGKYPIASLEDPFEQEDFTNFSELTKSIGKRVQIVGDDLLVTNVNRIKSALSKKACNTLLLKVNQIGTVTESINAAKLAYGSKWNVMVSHRSGDTEDTFIADLSVGIRSGQIKAGAPCRSERAAKYNQLIRIEEELGSKAKYGGII